MPADEEDQVAASHFGLGDQRREGGGIHGIARGVEKDFAGAGVPVPEIHALRPDFPHFGWCVAAGAAQEIRGQSVGVRIFGFADEIQEDLHPAGTWTVLALRQRRSRPSYSWAFGEKMWTSRSP